MVVKRRTNLKGRHDCQRFEFLLSGDFRAWLATSMVVPRGHIQPQKKRPKKSVETRMISPGQNRSETLKLSIKSKRGINGLNRRKRSEGRSPE